MRSLSWRLARRPLSAAAKKDKVLRHPLEWRKADFYAEEGIEEEMRRVLDVCHGCRRCFSLCDSFPILFNLIDASPTEELDSVPSSGIKKVADACTLCDMCFTAKCPYVPPHEFSIDFPHLVLRYRAWEQSHENLTAAEELGLVPGPVTQHHKTVPPAHVEEGVSRKLVKKPSSAVRRLYSDQNLMGPIASRMAPLVNAVTGTKQSLARKALEKVAGIHASAPLPPYTSQTLHATFTSEPSAPKEGQRRVAIFSGCFANQNRPNVGKAAVALLRASGVHVELIDTGCCGMPQLEQGLVGRVAEKGRKMADTMVPYLEKGADIISLTPSCTLMLKQEWPLLHPEIESIQRLGDSVFEVTEYLQMLKKEGELCGGAEPVEMDGAVTLHHACHARAQNMGWKSRDLLKGLPGLKVSAIERCSGHGGIWGFEEENYERAHKVGKAVVDRALKDAASVKTHYVTSDCPMAVDHLLDGMEREEPSSSSQRMHPIEILAKAYNISW